MSDKKLISVIIPVYNVENYLKRCILSVLNQTYTNLEIILIDDGSTDKSGIICDYFSKIDERVITIHKDNSGQSDARNYGLDICKGDYIYFIDSDDYADLNALEKMIKLIEENNADMVIADTNIVDKDGKIISISGNKLDDFEILTTQEAVDKFIESDWGPWNKLYSQNVHRNIRFPSGKIHEDEAIMLYLFFNTKKIVYTHEKLYNYLKRVGSTTGVNYNIKKMDWFDAWKKNVDIAKNKFPFVYDKVLFKMVITAIYNFDNLLFLNGADIDILKNDILHTLKKYQLKINFNKYISFNYKLRTNIALLNVNLYKKIFVRYK